MQYLLGDHGIELLQNGGGLGFRCFFERIRSIVWRAVAHEAEQGCGFFVRHARGWNHKQRRGEMREHEREKTRVRDARGEDFRMPVSDRDYMRDDFPRRSSSGARQPVSAFKWTMILISAVFVAQFGFGWLADHGRFMPWGGVSVRSLAEGHVWTIITYMFVHGSVGHFMVNMLLLWFVGRQVQALFGSRHFAQIFLFSGIFGAALEMMVYAFVHGNTVSPLISASASASPPRSTGTAAGTRARPRDWIALARTKPDSAASPATASSASAAPGAPCSAAAKASAKPW